MTAATVYLTRRLKNSVPEGKVGRKMPSITQPIIDRVFFIQFYILPLAVSGEGRNLYKADFMCQDLYIVGQDTVH